MHNNIDLIRRALVCSVASALPAWAQPSPDRSQPALLLGRWRSLSTSSGGIGTMLEFGPDGVVDFSPGAVVDMAYRIDNGQLVLPPATRGGPEVREAITWLGADRILFQSSAALDPGQEFARSGPRASAADPMLGEWIGSREMAGQTLKVLRLFRPGGKGLLLIPFLTKRGSYAIAGERLQMALPGMPASDAAFRVDDEVLTFTTADGKASRYERY